MELIVGLGNPGRPYVGTPHNLGFEVVEELARRWVVLWRESSRFRARLARRGGGESAITLLKPLTFMNLSGEAVAKASDFYAIDSANILVVSDDVNLPWGRLRLRKSGTDGGHNGLKSIIQRLGTNAFPRIRIGCAPAEDDPRDRVDYVLGRLGEPERSWSSRIAVAAADAVEAILSDGFDRAMNRFNALEIP